jgi:hypothetical protein
LVFPSKGKSGDLREVRKTIEGIEDQEGCRIFGCAS